MGLRWGKFFLALPYCSQNEVFVSPLSTFSCCIILCLHVFCLLVDLVGLSVPVQVIDWKDSSWK